MHSLFYHSVIIKGLYEILTCLLRDHTKGLQNHTVFHHNQLSNLPHWDCDFTSKQHHLIFHHLYCIDFARKSCGYFPHMQYNWDCTYYTSFDGH